MIGLLQSAEQYVEVKEFLKNLNKVRGQVAASPETFAAFLNGKTPDANSVKDICRIMSQMESKNNPNKQQELYTKYLANLAACNSITNNKGAGNKLPTYQDVDNSYYCFRQEITDASKKGPSSFVFADSSYASTVDAEKKKLADQEKVVATKKDEMKAAKSKIRKHRFLRALLALPLIAIALATGFAVYAGISWLAVQTLALSPLVLAAAAAPTVGGVFLAKYLFRHPWKKLKDKIVADKADYQAKKKVYEDESGKLAEQQGKFNELAKECDKNLAVKYPFEENFNETEAQMLFAERMQQIKEAGQTDEKQEIPAYTFAEDEIVKKVPEMKEEEKTSEIENSRLDNENMLDVEAEREKNKEFERVFGGVSDKEKDGELRSAEIDPTLLEEGIEENKNENTDVFANIAERDLKSKEVDENLASESSIDNLEAEEENKEAEAQEVPLLAAPANEKENEAEEEQEEPEYYDDDGYTENDQEALNDVEQQREDAQDSLMNMPAPEPSYYPYVPPYPYAAPAYGYPQANNMGNDFGLTYPKENYVSFVSTNKGGNEATGYYQQKPGASNKDAILATLATVNESPANKAIFKDSDGMELTIEKGIPPEMLINEYFSKKVKYKPIVKPIEAESEKQAAPTNKEVDKLFEEARPQATSARKKSQEEKRKAKVEAFKAEGRNVSKEEAIEIMNGTMEDDYVGAFDELSAPDFAKVESAVTKEYDAVRNMDTSYVTNEEDYLEELYRASYDKAVCDYYGRFVPREYASSGENKAARILSPISADVAHEKDLNNLDYGDLEDKKTILTYKQKAYEALLALGQFYEQDPDELNEISAKIEIAKQQLENVKNELVVRRANTKEMATAQIEGLINSGKPAKISAEDLKRAEMSIKETIKSNTDALAKEKKAEPKAPKKKASEEEKQAYKEAMAQHTKRCEEMQTEIDRNEQIRTLFDAYNFYKSNSYKTKDQINENLEAASLSQGARVYLNAMFRGAARKNTPKAKTGEKYLEEGTKTLKKEEEVHLSKYVPAKPVADGGEIVKKEEPKTKAKAEKVKEDKELDSMFAKAAKRTTEAEKTEEIKEETAEDEIERIIAEEIPEIKVTKSRNKGNVRSIEGYDEAGKKRATEKKITQNTQKVEKAVSDAEALLKQLEEQPQQESTIKEEKSPVVKADKEAQTNKKKDEEKPTLEEVKSAIEQKKKTKKQTDKKQEKTKASPKAEDNEPLKRVKKAHIQIEEAEQNKEQPKVTAVVPYTAPTTSLDIYHKPIDLNRKENPKNPRNIPELDEHEKEDGKEQ